MMMMMMMMLVMMIMMMITMMLMIITLFGHLNIHTHSTVEQFTLPLTFIANMHFKEV
jgi:hypothetical protein